VASGFEGRMTDSVSNGEGQGRSDFIRRIRYYLKMKKLQPGDKIVKIDKELGIAWILLPPDATLGGFQGISPRIMDEEKFFAAKKKPIKEEC
jgi:hypothetical protein